MLLDPYNPTTSDRVILWIVEVTPQNINKCGNRSTLRVEHECLESDSQIIPLRRDSIPTTRLVLQQKMSIVPCADVSTFLLTARCSGARVGRGGL